VRRLRRASAWLRDLAADLRHTVRILRKHRGFAATVILTAALGIGATSGVFSIVNAVLLRPLPYPERDRLVVAMTSWRGREAFVGISAPKFAEWQRASDG